MEIRRSSDRFAERAEGRLSRHGFSFGEHFDPDRLAFGPMVCHDDHLLGPGRGFEEHPHEELEIVTWVVSGALEHRGDTGTAVVLGAGECGVLSAGSGVRHAELAGTGSPGSPGGPARFVQVWLRPDSPDLPPAYARTTTTAGPGDGLVRVAGDGGLALGVAGAALDVARLGAGETLTLPAAPRVHVFLTSGALLRSSLAEPLAAGDALCVTADEAGPTSYEITAAVPTEVLVWSLP